ncbi:MAG TPA: YjjG family noncanonical pyrimidine nucleotidase [Flavobacteriales bacterium]|nr:YjjG family noncanonical pyrimidine nucleotidase [Flavobacteriales bacterium]HNU58240.1 YjjG family noncanonical pyrimidine nucleotidase [Flavobacteriales bacterium]
MRRYRHLFFDLDHTLWDFETNSRDTLRDLHALERLVDRGIPDAAAFIDAYEEINHGLWKRYESGHIDRSVLRVLRFRNTLLRFGVKDERLADRMGRDYLALTPKRKALMPGARELLADLGSLYRIHVITNGFHEVQEEKIASSGLGHHFDLVLSSEMAGAKKPDPRIFRAALERTKASAGESLMIGDNPEADIAGARNAGWDQAHFAPNGGGDERATYVLGRLDDLRTILL